MDECGEVSRSLASAQYLLIVSRRDREELERIIQLLITDAKVRTKFPGRELSFAFGSMFDRVGLVM